MAWGFICILESDWLLDLMTQKHFCFAHIYQVFFRTFSHSCSLRWISLHNVENDFKMFVFLQHYFHTSNKTIRNCSFSVKVIFLFLCKLGLMSRYYSDESKHLSRMVPWSDPMVGTCAQFPFTVWCKNESTVVSSPPVVYDVSLNVYRDFRKKNEAWKEWAETVDGSAEWT